MEAENKDIEKGYFDADSLSRYLSVSKRFIVKNTWRLPGRVKCGKLVRYDRVAIEKALLRGSLFPAKR